MKRICQPKQGIAGGFDPHNKAAGGVVRVFEKKTREKLGYFLNVQIIGIAQGSIYVKAQCFHLGVV
jgi:hypothetical protein